LCFVELVLIADKVLFVGDFNIHVDNEKDALGLAFKGPICNFFNKMNPFLLPVFEGVVMTHCNDPLFGFGYYL